MTLTIEMPPEIEAALAAQARQQGQSVPEFALAVLAEAARVRRAQSITEHGETPQPDPDIEARLAALEKLDTYARNLPNYRAGAGLGPLPDDAVADTYREREDAQR